MTLPAHPPAYVPLVQLVRDGMVEGVHHGSVVVHAPDGGLRWSLGDATTPIYPRSAAKPLQAVALLRAGLDLPADQLALAGASHSGEAIHLATAEAILAGLDADLLGNPADLPYDPIEHDAWVAAGRGPSRLAHNCSGKHAAMLRACRLNGWPVEGYLSPDHPLQRLVAEVVTELSGEKPAHVAADGCGAPLFALSLSGLARAIARIATAPAGTPEHTVASAYRSHPELVAGNRRDTTALMRVVPGLLAKDGFEGVQVLALPDGTTAAIKIADGSDRARHAATLAVLRRLGVDPVALAGVRQVGVPDSLTLRPVDALA
ncbi:MAG TPA: asparaginase [Nocardioides sp.]|nr:asparaginase [Nocardioides sp.]